MNRMKEYSYSANFSDLSYLTSCAKSSTSTRSSAVLLEMESSTCGSPRYEPFFESTVQLQHGGQKVRSKRLDSVICSSIICSGKETTSNFESDKHVDSFLHRPSDVSNDWNSCRGHTIAQLARMDVKLCDASSATFSSDSWKEMESKHSELSKPIAFDDSEKLILSSKEMGGKNELNEFHDYRLRQFSSFAKDFKNKEHYLPFSSELKNQSIDAVQKSVGIYSLGPFGAKLDISNASALNTGLTEPALAKWRSFSRKEHIQFPLQHIAESHSEGNINAIIDEDRGDRIVCASTGSRSASEKNSNEKSDSINDLRKENEFKEEDHLLVEDVLNGRSKGKKEIQKFNFDSSSSLDLLSSRGCSVFSEEIDNLCETVLTEHRPKLITAGKPIQDMEIVVDGRVTCSIAEFRKEWMRRKWSSEDVKRVNYAQSSFRHEAANEVIGLIARSSNDIKEGAQTCDTSGDGVMGQTSMKTESIQNRKRHLELTKRQIKEAKLHMKLFGEWVKKERFMDDEEEELWTEAERRMIEKEKKKNGGEIGEGLDLTIEEMKNLVTAENVNGFQLETREELIERIRRIEWQRSRKESRENISDLMRLWQKEDQKKAAKARKQGSCQQTNESNNRRDETMLLKEDAAGMNTYLRKNKTGIIQSEDDEDSETIFRNSSSYVPDFRKSEFLLEKDGISVNLSVCNEPKFETQIPSHTSFLFEKSSVCGDTELKNPKQGNAEMKRSIDGRLEAFPLKTGSFLMNGHCSLLLSNPFQHTNSDEASRPVFISSLFFTNGMNKASQESKSNSSLREHESILRQFIISSSHPLELSFRKHLSSMSDELFSSLSSSNISKVNSSREECVTERGHSDEGKDKHRIDGLEWKMQSCQENCDADEINNIHSLGDVIFDSEEFLGRYNDTFFNITKMKRLKRWGKIPLEQIISEAMMFKEIEVYGYLVSCLFENIKVYLILLTKILEYHSVAIQKAKETRK
eukprot:MONOS_5641.1-p1 / transcript=MONOS_5641.1 / gene=MONOS_5641 / organism=Monocercomonoides_exilis_PA203 / gene_product=unspecified product / transcript_product=unspecified product / location=Mono_scaffold00166:81249-84371(-) / protein_length=974 / sequence_SO=supercontig / SO=protein_coding / is_pseudo=false